MAGDEERRAGLCEPVEQLPEIPAQHGVEAHRRLVEDEPLRTVEQGGRERYPAALSTGEAAADPVRLPAEVDLGDRLLDATGSDTEDLGEVLEVLADGQVAAH